MQDTQFKSIRELEAYSADIYTQFMLGLTPVERQYIIAGVERLNHLEASGNV